MLQSKEHRLLSESHNEIGPAQGRELLRSFSDAKILLVKNKLVEELSRSRKLEEGNSLIGLFPAIKELSYSAGR